MKEGIYKIAGGSKAIIGTTRTVGDVVITSGFAAPEIERASRDGSWDKLSFEDLTATDIYSLGKVLQCMICLTTNPESLEVNALSARPEHKALIASMISKEIDKRPRLVRIKGEFGQGQRNSVKAKGPLMNEETIHLSLKKLVAKTDEIELDFS